MICEHCQERIYAEDGYAEVHPACFEMLQSQLVSMTKRAEDALRAEVTMRRIADAEQAKACDAEDKLATAVEALTDIRGRVPLTQSSWRIADSTLHALGIDPSKEHGK